MSTLALEEKIVENVAAEPGVATRSPAGFHPQAVAQSAHFKAHTETRNPDGEDKVQKTSKQPENVIACSV